MKKFCLLFGVALAAMLAPLLAQAAAPADLPENAAPGPTVILPNGQEVPYVVITKNLQKARNNLSPQTGTSAYVINNDAIDNLAQGPDTSFNDVLEQAPGVAQDSFGQLHVRGEHADLQYRINGVQLPEGITGFGQVLSPRFAENINLLTGALPAEYGYRTAGVVDIHSKSGLSLSGGNLDMYGGQHSTLQPSFELGGSKDKLDYFFSGQYLQNQLGVEPPTVPWG